MPGTPLPADWAQKKKTRKKIMPRITDMDPLDLIMARSLLAWVIEELEVFKDNSVKQQEVIDGVDNITHLPVKEIKEAMLNGR